VEKIMEAQSGQAGIIGKETTVVTAATAALGAWAAAIAAASVGGKLEGLAPPETAGLIVGGIALPTLAYALSPGLQRLFDRIGLRRLTAFHAWRAAAGVAFLVWGAQGRLPQAFTDRAGWGDIVSAVLAAGIAAFWPKRGAYWFFNVVGLADLLIAIRTGLMLRLAGVTQMGGVGEFPIALIPFFAVGVTAATHLIAFRMLWAGRRSRRPVESPAA
jgi:hypothetical protein